MNFQTCTREQFKSWCLLEHNHTDMLLATDKLIECNRQGNLKYFQYFNHLNLFPNKKVIFCTI